MMLNRQLRLLDLSLFIEFNNLKIILLNAKKFHYKEYSPQIIALKSNMYYHLHKLHEDLRYLGDNSDFA